MPSGRPFTAPLFSSASIVVAGSAAGAKAPVPSVVVRRVVGEPWPSGLKVQPWRPRPTRTQPPPSVVMSQANWVGRSRPRVSSQYDPEALDGYCCLMPQHDAPAVGEVGPSPGCDTAASAERCRTVLTSGMAATTATRATAAIIRVRCRPAGMLSSPSLDQPTSGNAERGEK